MDSIPLTPQTQSLPDMQGAGWVRDLREAASQTTPQGQALAAALTAYTQADTRDAQLAQLDGLIAAWGNSSGVKGGRIVGYVEAVNDVGFERRQKR